MDITTTLRVRDFWVYTLVALYGTFAWWVVPQLFINQGFGDSDRYMAIAQDPFVFTTSPWGYRVVVPWAARALTEVSNLGLMRSFQLLQYIAWTGSLVFLAYACLALRAQMRVMFLCVLVYSVGYQFIYYRHNFIHIGFFELGLTACLVWFLYIGAFKWSCALIAIGTLVKESIPFVVLLTAGMYWISESFIFKRQALKFFEVTLLVVVAVSLFFLVRTLIGPESSTNFDSYTSFLNAEFLSRLTENLPWRFAEYVTTYGCLSVVILYSLKFFKTDPFVRLCLFLVVAVTFQLALALDTRRMASVAILVVLLLTVRLATSHGLRIYAIVMLALSTLYSVAWMLQLHALAVASLVASVLYTLYKHIESKAVSNS